jgi:type IV secretion system protein VirB4
MLDLRGYRKRAKGLADLTPYLFLVDNGIVANKDCSLTAAWEYRGSDTASSTQDELDFVAGQVNQALMSLGTGWMVQVDAVRRPSTSYPAKELSHFPDPVSAAIDEERRGFFSRASCFETNTVITLTYKPSGSLAMDIISSRKTGDKMLAEFKDHIAAFESSLSGVLDLERLNEYVLEDRFGQPHLYSTLLSHLQLCLTGDLHPVMVPQPVAMYLDGILGNQDLTGGEEPRLGDKRLYTISIDGFPQESYPAILEMLSGLPLAYRFNTRYICLDPQDAIKELETQRKGWAQQIFNPIDIYLNRANPRLNRDAAWMNEDAEQAKAQVQNGQLGYGFLSSTVVLMSDDDELSKKEAQYVQRELGLLGFGSRLERYNALEAWLGSHPGNWWANQRRPLISTLNVSHLLPLASIWPGEPEAPCPFYSPKSPPLMVCTTDGSTPFRFNLHSGDVGHTMILGPTGAGKSTLLALICAQFLRYPEAQVFAFDKGRSLYALCEGVGGTHYDVGGDDSTLAFAPLSRIDESDAEFIWACDWVGKLLEIQGLKLEPSDLNYISTAMRRLRSQPARFRTLYILRNLLPNRRLKEGLAQYSGDGPMARLLDSQTDNLGMSDFLVFEIEDLMNMGEKYLVPVLLYLFRQIEKALTGRASLLVLDEAWIMLANEVFQAQIREWFKVLRKANCAVILATQSLSDASRSGILDILAESCPTKIYLPNYEANNETQRGMYLGLGLNSRQVTLIASGTPKRDYYVETRGQGRRMMQLSLGRRTLAWVGSSGKKDIADLKRLKAERGLSWREDWERHKRAA